MKNLRARWWSVAFVPLTLLSVALFWLAIMVVVWLKNPQLEPATGYHPAYLAGCSAFFQLQADNTMKILHNRAS